MLASLSGFAFIDANGDGQRDPADFGLPGVRIELENTDATVARTAITTDVGFYAFTNLPPGNYSVKALQPEAVHDGTDSTSAPGAQLGNDVISNLQLSESDSIREINFGESGIKSEYVSPLWVLSSSATTSIGALLRGVVAGAEQVAGNAALAEQIRASAESGVVSKPVATTDRYLTVTGEQLVVSAANGLLQNDFEPTNRLLAVELAEPPINGTLSLNSDGSFSYVSDSNLTGVETFTYVAVGDVASEPTTVAIEVAAPPNRAPLTVSDTFSVLEDAELTISSPGVLANDTDLDGDTLTVSLTSQPANGTVNFNADGSFTFVPNADYLGDDTFAYVASDGELESAETLVQIAIVPVNDPPVGNSDSYVTNENETLVVEAVEGVLVNDADIDGDSLESVLEDDATNGTVMLGSDGAFTYTPDLGFSGLDSFTYLASDGVDVSNTVTVTIDVGSVNDAPIASDDSFATDEDTTLIADNLSVLANDTDLDDDPLTATLDQQAANGVVVLNSDGTFDYTPNSNFNGSDSFSYVANDGLRSSAAATVTIAVSPVNDPPDSSVDEYTINQGETLTVDSANGVLANDTDVENDPLSASIVDLPSQGQVNLQSDGAFEFIPAANFAGSITFTYQANDGVDSSEATTVTINVTSVNSAPVASVDLYEVDQDAVLTVEAADGVLANDSDLDGDQLTAELTTQPENGSIDLAADGSFIYTPTPGFNGTDTFGYTASDGAVSSPESMVTISVRPVAVTITDTVTLGASKDNSLFESATGELSNGTGEYLFVGKTLQTENFLRRGLIAFDFSSIPSDATITDVSLTLNMSRTIVGAFDVTLHRVTQDWGEGPSDALAEEGTGIDSADSDATWLHSFFNSQLWSTPGGDFTSEVSASTSVDGVGFYNWTSTQMVADVQAWLDDPASNAGWLLLTDENDISAKRFDSRENSTEANRPQLVVEYEFTSGGAAEPITTGQVSSSIPHDSVFEEGDLDLNLPGDTNADGMVNFRDFLTLANNFGKTDAVFAEADGDFNGDGAVNFNDFLVLSAHFGR